MNVTGFAATLLPACGQRFEQIEHWATSVRWIAIPRAELKRAATRTVASGAATLEQAERQVIIDALKSSVRTYPADVHGPSERTLQNKMRKLNVSRDEHST